jgi:hypothetical protein
MSLIAVPSSTAAYATLYRGLDVINKLDSSCHIAGDPLAINEFAGKKSDVNDSRGCRTALLGRVCIIFQDNTGMEGTCLHRYRGGDL